LQSIIKNKLKEEKDGFISAAWIKIAGFPISLFLFLLYAVFYAAENDAMNWQPPAFKTKFKASKIGR